MKKKYNLFFAFLLCSISELIAQDIHFSQFIYNPLNLNPANTGLFNGDIRATAAYRRQWSSITVPYKTFSLSYDQNVGKLFPMGISNAAGIVINDDRAGDGNFGTLQALFSFSNLLSLHADSNLFINIGVQFGITYRSLDVSKLTFDNQYNGDAFVSGSSSGENFDKNNYVYPEFNSGVNLIKNFENSTLTTGLGIQHINRANQTFFNEKVRLPVRWQFHADAKIKSGKTLNLQPSLLFMIQQQFVELTGGMEAKLILREEISKRFAVGLGVYSRMSDAIIPNIALYYNQWRFGLTYDINTSPLKVASNQKGGPEFNVNYIMRKVSYTKQKSICPVY